MLEQRLADLNALCILLTLLHEMVELRFIEIRAEDWKAYVMNGGRSVAETCRQFLGGQDRLRQWAADSLIPTIEIGTDDADWDRYAQQMLQGVAK